MQDSSQGVRRANDGTTKELKVKEYRGELQRNFDEILRVLDSLQLTATKKVATPVDWKQGGQCMVVPSVSEEDAKKLFPEHKVTALPSGKKYLRLTPQPQ